MVVRCLTILLFIQTLAFVTGQYNNVKPDIGFGDHNERFDITDLLRSQNQYYDRLERQETRRDFGRMIDPVITRQTKPKLTGKNFIKGDNILSRLLKVFGDDLRRDDEESNVGDNEKLNAAENNTEDVMDKITEAEKLRRRNLQKYVDKLHGIHAWDFQSRRKMADPEEEILMHHAVPFNFKVNGYLTERRLQN